MNWYEYYRQQDYLEHHGILGQKWGVRRFQNSDGSLTTEGAKRYIGIGKAFKKPETSKGSKIRTVVDEYRNTDISKLTNAQMNEVINRSRLEVQYRQALRDYDSLHASKATRAANIVKNKMYRTADRVANRMMDRIADKTVDQLVSMKKD